MTVFQAIAELSKASWRVLRRHPCLAWFPLMSFASVVAMFLFVVPIIVPGAHDDELSWFTFYVITVLLYVTQMFFSVALTAEALRALRGEKPAIANGLATAAARAPAVASLSLITATVGFVIGLL